MQHRNIWSIFLFGYMMAFANSSQTVSWKRPRYFSSLIVSPVLFFGMNSKSSPSSAQVCQEDVVGRKLEPLHQCWVPGKHSCLTLSSLQHRHVLNGNFCSNNRESTTPKPGEKPNHCCKLSVFRSQMAAIMGISIGIWTLVKQLRLSFVQDLCNRCPGLITLPYLKCVTVPLQPLTPAILLFTDFLHRETEEKERSFSSAACFAFWNKNYHQT